MDYKIIIGIITIVLAFVGYAPYVRDIIRRKTTPHAFTWLVWTLAVGITCALQIVGGAGPGAWTTVAITGICSFVFLLSLKYGDSDIAKMDMVFLVCALFALGLWLVAKQPVLSVILIVLTDVLGFAPTVRKSWNKSYSETLVMYEITAVRHGLSIFALMQFNMLTAVYPIVWTLANLAFSVMLLVRRKAMAKSGTVA
jgi:hypothetical protein